jgi:hypothetical protein
MIIFAMVTLACFLANAMYIAFCIDFGAREVYVTADGELNIDGRGLPVNID